MQPMILTIPLVPMSRNDRDRAHWAKRKKELDDWTLVIPEAQKNNRQQENGLPRMIEVVFCKTRGKESDPDNLVARCKVVLDALVRRGWLYDDSPIYCKLEVREETRAPERQTTIGISAYLAADRAEG